MLNGLDETAEKMSLTTMDLLSRRLGTISPKQPLSLLQKWELRLSLDHLSGQMDPLEIVLLDER